MSIKIIQWQQALPEAWAQRVAAWTNPLGRPVSPALEVDESWWLALDAAEQPQACLRWRPALGRKLPRPHFHVGRVVHASPELGLFQTLATLQLGHDLTGQAEIADLAGAENAEPAVFAALIESATEGRSALIELQGERDTHGHSPFWQGLGRHFFAGNVEATWARFGEAWLAQLAGLLPRQTIYLPFLSAEAQAALGQTGPAAAEALAALQQLGWAAGDHVRIDDGGPVWRSAGR